MKKQNNFKYYFFIIFISMAIFLFFWQRFHWPKAVVSLKGENLQVLIANSIYRQQKGLGGRASISPYDGMIFPFSTLDRHAFIMRDMNFPIDIIWLKKGEIVDYAPNVQIEPNHSEETYIRYTPRTDDDMVLELPAGWAQAHDLKIGDKMTLVED
ncbi:MAG: hypothetical protein COY69_01975 [Candidatus Magasanikbacteria bacterium CG_4_10_14_0_8_um_filter_32_14]|uniref:DUF192 domain-containing protein n=1 Tax=Candidatus Magasanikbacteria bacterium CG_4_10_14_0_8_um_filter_32_14 TaxID=1974640 RepID=A0A2M7R9D6_9BACT|nr:MAG: hypothetical protein COY69_01975 [Candidatus Magasanikbacteria bacterium CG_4_10_14_0_8_um_filter_32_14]